MLPHVIPSVGYLTKILERVIIILPSGLVDRGGVFLRGPLQVNVLWHARLRVHQLGEDLEGRTQRERGSSLRGKG